MMPKTKIIILVGAITLLALGAIAGYYILNSHTDSEQDIKETQKKLKFISQALKKFKSEAYFGRPPQTLYDLHQYTTTYYNTKPNPGSSTNLYQQNNEQTTDATTNFSANTDNYSLIPNKRVFLKSTLDKEAEDKIIRQEGFTSDYGFIPNYSMFPAANTIIAWDQPGNFNSGGNILFEDGGVKFIQATPEEYRRFTTGLQTQTDRNFIRDLCIRNHTDCSLVNLKRSETAQ